MIQDMQLNGLYMPKYRPGEPNDCPLIYKGHIEELLMNPPAFDMHADWSFETAGYQGQLCMYKHVPTPRL